jgi:hypothetical protein
MRQAGGCSRRHDATQLFPQFKKDNRTGEVVGLFGVFDGKAQAQQ